MSDMKENKRVKNIERLYLIHRNGMEWDCSLDNLVFSTSPDVLVKVGLESLSRYLGFSLYSVNVGEDIAERVRRYDEMNRRLLNIYSRIEVSMDELSDMLLRGTKKEARGTKIAAKVKVNGYRL